MITEFVKFKVLDSVSGENLISKAESLNTFLSGLDGFLDSELVKDTGDNLWGFIYHFESMEKVKLVGEKMRSSKEFSEFNSLVLPGSNSISFFHQLRKW